MYKCQDSWLGNYFSRNYLIWIGSFILGTTSLLGQNQNLADSLEVEYLNERFTQNNRLELLKNLAFEHPNPEKSLLYSKELLKSALALDSSRYIIAGYQQIGNGLKLKGDLSEALANYLEGVEIAKKEERNRELGLLYLSISGVYRIMGNHKNTVTYFKNALPILKEAQDTLNYANALENLGDFYNLNLSKPDSALYFFKQSGAIFKTQNSKIGVAYNLGNSGLAYAQLGQNKIAEENISQAIAILEELGDYYPISVYLTYMADIYANRDDWSAAFEYANRSLALANQFGLKEEISNAYLKLAELYERRGNFKESLNFFRNHIQFKDTVRNITEVQRMGELELSKKELELNLSKQEQRTQFIINIATTIALCLIGLLAFGLYRRYKFINKTKNIIEKEKDRSDNLLLNILPKDTAEELKENGKVVAKKFDSVTVLFTDFKGFTHYSENLDPEKLVETIGFYFMKFDDIMEKYGLEKIKTIGDSYMCAGGLPYPSNDHAHKMVLAAFEIMDFVNHAKQNSKEGQIHFDTRIGINTGMVVAGVVGSKKFSYDIWGDTVNVASRMETMAEPGKINISESTYNLVKDQFYCEARGEIYAKNRGMMKMFYVNKAKETVQIKSTI